MPTRLLDLSDEILAHIAHFVNNDTSIPFPAFTPHWANFPVAVESSNRDQLRFRATCRRIRSLYRLQGLHLVVKSWGILEQWCHQVPDSVINGMRRIVIDIKPFNETESTSDQVDGEMLSMWSIFITFLSQFTSLEELIILNTPFCQHDIENLQITSRTLDLPTFDYLPTLKSLGFQIKCRFCANYIPRLFIPAAPKLLHLKTICPTKIGAMITNIIKTWSSIHPDKTHPLRSLYYRLNEDADLNEELSEINETFPLLEELYFSAHGSCNHGFHDSSTAKSEAPMIIAKSDSLVVPDKWAFEWHGVLDFELILFPRFPGRCTYTPCDFLDFVEKLGVYRNLRKMDCSINFVLHSEHGMPSIFMPATERGRLEYDRFVRAQRSKTIAYQGVNIDKLRRTGMTEAARIIMDEIPTLEECIFWTEVEISGPSFEVWSKYTIIRKYDDEGKSIVEVDPYVERFPVLWTSNEDGQCDTLDGLPESDTDDSESEGDAESDMSDSESEGDP
ncbi:uncharacterized protein I206_106035 [Kwoniella pini CBS 10737]|uniref:Uncharacterized protein n=1 Tax=Kwoniella pini CBS 10737 TaxID=1296096 RepID=A0A1B9I0V3_9TREE|nr:uncharacterized protein I206_04858 [Kwoniella pini CBS 10737]OCF49170.1 hypothetical protein I206_04858 [Kwoniella pini CBS 10737]